MASSPSYSESTAINPKTHEKMKRTIVLLAFSAAMASSASAATVFGFNFVSNWPNPLIQDQLVDGTSNWTDTVDHASPNATAPANSTDDWAVTTSAYASGVSIAWSSKNLWSAGAEVSKDQALYRVYLDDGGAGPTVTISGLDQWLTAEGATGYNLTIYRSSDMASTNKFAQLDIYSGSGTDGTLLESIAPELAAGGGNYPDALDGDGARLKQVATSTFTEDVLTFHSANGLGGNGAGRGSIAGFKIEAVPEPSVAILLGFGGFAFLLRRRK
jgi:hypothetical protein